MSQRFALDSSHDIPHRLILALNTLNLVAIHYQVSSCEIHITIDPTLISSQILGVVPALTDVLSRIALILRICYTDLTPSLTPILVSRFMLNLREVNIQLSGGTGLEAGPLQVSDVVFASRVIGNLGASLDFGRDDSPDELCAAWGFHESSGLAELDTIDDSRIVMTTRPEGA